MRASPKERDFLLRAKPSKNSESADSEARSLSFPWAVSGEGSLCATRRNFRENPKAGSKQGKLRWKRSGARTQFTVFMRKVGLNFYSVAHFRVGSVLRKNGPYSSACSKKLQRWMVMTFRLFSRKKVHSIPFSVLLSRETFQSWKISYKTKPTQCIISYLKWSTWAINFFCVFQSQNLGTYESWDC